MKKCVLGDVARSIQTGPFGSQLHQSDYTDCGTPVVMPKDVVNGDIVDTSIARVGPQHVSRLSRHQLRPGNLIFSRRGDVGRCALVKKEQNGWLCGTGCLRVVVDEEKINSSYLYYFLCQSDVAKWLESHAVGAIMLNINPSIVSQIPISFPTRGAQEQIANLLSALDRKIALNRRKIATLEKMAKEIYDYWFVQYDFPDANGRPYKSSGGEMVYSPELKREIPKGWKVEQLKDVLKVCNGKDHKSRKDGTIPVYGSGGVMRCVDTAMYSQPSVLIPRKGTLNNIIYARKPFWCVDTIFYTTSTVSNFTKYLYYSIRDMDFMSLNTGTAVPSMTAGVIGLIAIPMPTLGLLESFDKTLEHLFLSRDSAQDEVDRLITLRDFLLPLLMNGQARIGGVA